MKWIDKIIGDYEKKEKSRKTKVEEEKNKMRAEFEQKRQQATTALGDVYESFFEFKKKLRSKGYPCEANLSRYTNVHTGKQHSNEAILIVRNKPLTIGTDLSKTNSPYISFSEIRGSDNLQLEINTTESKKPPEKMTVSIKKINQEYVDEQIESFIKEVFS